MAPRFLRDFRLVVRLVNGELVEIRPPARVAFDVSKSVQGGLNSATIRVWGLGKQKRLALTKDVETVKNIDARLSVGYLGALSQVFSGTVQRGEVIREGADIVVEMYCLDGGADMLGTYISETVRGRQEAINAILGRMPGTSYGVVSELQPYSRPRVLVGPPARLFDDIASGADWFIDDSRLYILNPDDVVSENVPIVEGSTGLLGTPSREHSRVSFETQFSPAIRLGGLIKMNSQNAPHLNGVYKIDAMGYTGDNYGADWSQSVTGILRPGAS